MPDAPMRGIADRSTVDVPAWAADIRTGDTVDLDTPRGVIAAEVIGFSEAPAYYGQPVVEVPGELEDALPEASVLVVREEDLADEPEVRADGGQELPEGYEPPKELPTAELREGETPDASSHAARNAEQLRIAEREREEER